VTVIPVAGAEIVAGVSGTPRADTVSPDAMTTSAVSSKRTTPRVTARE